jgi:hypothetical protein
MPPAARSRFRGRRRRRPPRVEFLEKLRDGIPQRRVFEIAVGQFPPPAGQERRVDVQFKVESETMLCG